MDNQFEEHLGKDTKTIITYFSSSDISEGERDAIASVYADALTSGIGDPDRLKDAEAQVFLSSLQYIDTELSRILSNPSASYRDYETGLSLCSRQKSLVQLFHEKNWAIPTINNTNLDKCYSVLSERRESTSISDRILETDQKIDELVVAAHKTLSVKTCDQVLALVNELDQEIDLCKKKRIPLPTINNKDIKKVKKNISDLRKVSEQKEQLHHEIYGVDLQIHSIVSAFPSLQDQWPNLISLCQTQSGQLETCIKNRWQVPAIRHEQPAKIASRFMHYIEMVNTDNTISRTRNTLNTNKQYREFFHNCTLQESNIVTCLRNNWPVPHLSNTDPGKLINAVQGEKSRKDKRKRFKLNLFIALVVFVIIASLALFGIIIYREGKIEIPFDSSHVMGQ